MSYLENPKFLPTIFLVIGLSTLYRAYGFAHQYGVQTEFSYTVLAFIPIGIVMSMLLIRSLISNNKPGNKVNTSSWKKFRGPYSINLILLLILASSFILHLIFTYERFLREGAWESWHENPAQLASLILAVSISKTTSGVLWTIVRGTELIWWLMKDGLGRKEPTQP